MKPWHALAGIRDLGAWVGSVVESVTWQVVEETGFPYSHALLMDTLPYVYLRLAGRLPASELAIRKLSLEPRPSVDSLTAITRATIARVEVARPAWFKIVAYLPPNMRVDETVARKIAWQAFACGGMRRRSLGELHVPAESLPRLRELLFAMVSSLPAEEGWSPWEEVVPPSDGVPLVLWDHPFPPMLREGRGVYNGPVLSLVPYGGEPPEGVEPFGGRVFFHISSRMPDILALVARPRSLLAPL